MLPLPLLPPFSAFQRCRHWAAFSVFRFCVFACACGGMFASPAAFLSSSRFPLRPSCHKIPTPLYPNKCKQWLKAGGSLEKWKPKDAGQISFLVFPLKALTCMCLQYATSVVLVACLLDTASRFRCPRFLTRDRIFSCTTR